VFISISHKHLSMPTLIFYRPLTYRGRVFIISHKTRSCTHFFMIHVKSEDDHGNLFPRGIAFLRIESLMIIFYRIDFIFVVFRTITNSMLHTFYARTWQKPRESQHKRMRSKRSHKKLCWGIFNGEDEEETLKISDKIARAWF
jgi:hypothetical protein